MKKIACLFILTLLLMACKGSDKFHDLQDYIKNLDQSTSTTKIQKVSLEHFQVQKVIYHKEKSRTPFEEIETAQATHLNVGPPLTRYPLNLLKFVGTVSQNNTTSAYIMTPDGKIYPVTIGDRIGISNGRISKITENSLEVEEPELDEKNIQQTRKIILQLKDEHQ